METPTKLAGYALGLMATFGAAAGLGAAVGPFDPDPGEPAGHDVTHGISRVPLDLSEADEYRVFADFVPVGQDKPLTLGADLSVSGSYVPQPLPPPSTTARVGGYTVALAGELVPGEESRHPAGSPGDGSTQPGPELTVDAHTDTRMVHQ